MDQLREREGEGTSAHSTSRRERTADIMTACGKDRYSAVAAVLALAVVAKWLVLEEGSSGGPAFRDWRLHLNEGLVWRRVRAVGALRDAAPVVIRLTTMQLNWR